MQMQRTSTGWRMRMRWSWTIISRSWVTGATSETRGNGCGTGEDVSKISTLDRVPGRGLEENGCSGRGMFLWNALTTAIITGDDFALKVISIVLDTWKDPRRTAKGIHGCD